MPKVIIYSANYCPYCNKAKTLLKSKNIAFDEINIENNNELKQEMIERSNGRKTIPQIFIDEKHVGGFDDLYELEVKGELDALLK
jgi:glutaredoxin 3